MDIDATFKPDAQLAEGCQPRVRALHYPSVTPKSIIALDSSAGKANLDATQREVRAAACKVVVLVGMQLRGPAQWSRATRVCSCAFTTHGRAISISRRIAVSVR